MKSIKLIIIGTITRDTITFPDGREKRSFGGILYNIFPLALFAPQNLTISPVCNLGSDIYEKVILHLKRFKNIDLCGISRVKENNNHVHLYYDRKGNKKEVLKNLVPRVEYEQIKPYLHSDYLLVNFISGFDISLGSLKKIKENTKAKIFMDLHSLLLGIKESGERYFRVPFLWKEYLELANIVQMNLKEVEVLSGKKLKSREDLGEFAQGILKSGPQILLVTCGRVGALAYYKENKKSNCYSTASLKIKDAVDPTGCGDVFSSGFLLAYMKNKDIKLSSEFANFLAGMKSRFSGIENFLKL